MATAPKTYPSIILGFFARGLNTNRQPLFSALTGVGLQVIQFKDYLVDGINVECSDKFTLQRAPGFVKYCSAQLAVSEKVNQFYGARDLSGNIYVLADTNQNLYKVTSSALTSLLTKGTTAQGFIQTIGGVTYYADGTNLKKWLPPAASMVPWGVGAPLVAPTVAGVPLQGSSFWQPSTVYSPYTSILDINGNIQFTVPGGTTSSGQIPSWRTQIETITNDGSVVWTNGGVAGVWQATTAYTKPTVILDTNSNMWVVTTAGTSGGTVPVWGTTIGGSLVDGTVTWTNIGPGQVLAYSNYSYAFCYRTVTGNLSTASPATNTGPVVIDSTNAVTITAWSITANVATFTAVNRLQGGQHLLLGGFSSASFFNNQAVTVIAPGLSGTQFEVAFTHANGSGTENGIASAVIASLTGASSSNSECNSTAAITSVQVASGVATISATNNFSPGINVQFSGLSGAAFLNGLILQVASATTTSFTVGLPTHANYGPTGDSGTATFLAVEVYRTADGGGVYYFDGAALNGGTWAFSDIATDSQLDTELVCSPPGEHQNDPPPAGATLLAWWNNRIWIAVGNKLYFTGGPDTLNGIGEECVPPGNVFVFPGTISSLNATTGGLVVVIPEEVWAILGGPQTVTFYPEKILSKFGALSPNCAQQDGDMLVIYSSQKQLIVLSGAGRSELGAGGSGVCPVGNLLADGTATLSVTASAWSPTASYLAIHKQGQDSGIYLSNGVESIIRYGVNVGNFSPVRQPFVNGAAVAGAIQSVETSAGQYSLLFGPTTTHDYIYARSLTTFADNGHAYPSNAVIGNIVVTEPGQPLAPLHFITAYLYNAGSVPTVGFIPNDITPAAFTNLPSVQNDPAFLAAPLSLISKRWPVMMNQGATPILLRHLQVKIDFGATDMVKNELIELGLRFENEQML